MRWANSVSQLAANPMPAAKAVEGGGMCAPTGPSDILREGMLRRAMEAEAIMLEPESMVIFSSRVSLAIRASIFFSVAEFWPAAFSRWTWALHGVTAASTNMAVKITARKLPLERGRGSERAVIFGLLKGCNNSGAASWCACELPEIGYSNSGMGDR